MDNGSGHIRKGKARATHYLCYYQLQKETEARKRSSERLEITSEKGLRKWKAAGGTVNDTANSSRKKPRPCKFVGGEGGGKVAFPNGRNSRASGNPGERDEEGSRKKP